jgi:hypothetical protein
MPPMRLSHQCKRLKMLFPKQAKEPDGHSADRCRPVRATELAVRWTRYRYVGFGVVRAELLPPLPVVAADNDRQWLSSH